ncbi:fasciclin domain-containing protein [Spirosoma rhododendri]|uniref:fasciclin domain-containing protein n=1 Tax=Spirosoma rhododendri TaxID=2728024 RepID=UPI0020C1C079|nr:fasciclin domain-containing protein [Spirosoma rhododendri]
MFHTLNVKNLRRAGLAVLTATLLITGCTNNTPDPQPGTGTTQPGSGTVTNPGSTTPGSGTTTTPTSPTLTVVASVTYIAQQSNLTLLRTAIVRAGLIDEFNKSGITIFAPSDDAFRAGAIVMPTRSTTRRCLSCNVFYAIMW